MANGGSVQQEELDRILLDLEEWFGELDDSGEGLFGEYARVRMVDGALVVKHQDNDAIAVVVTVKAV